MPRGPKKKSFPPVVVDRHGARHHVGGIGLSKLAELTATKEIPSFRIGRRRLYRVADLDAWLEAKVEG
jgi:excisionase family DNA binding protein